MNLWFRRKISSMGLGKSAPAPWHDQYNIIDRFTEYVQDGRFLSNDALEERWWAGYYATPIPSECALDWIEKYGGGMIYEKKKSWQKNIWV